MKPYSLDLREKIVEAYLQNDGSIRQLAQRFKVSARFVWALITQLRRTGSYAPKPHGGGNPPCIALPQQAMIFALVQQYPAATLEELCRHVVEKHQVTISKSSMQRLLAKLQLTRKKSPSTRQNVPRMTLTGNVRSIKRK